MGERGPGGELNPATNESSRPCGRHRPDVALGTELPAPCGEPSKGSRAGPAMHDGRNVGAPGYRSPMPRQTAAAGLSRVQLAAALGLAPWQWARARRDGLIPAADLGDRWSQAIADDLAPAAAGIRAAAGELPDLGAHRAAEVLAARLGIPVTADGVEELSRRGQLPGAGDFKGCPLYDGRALEQFADEAAATAAGHAGRTRTAEQAAGYMRIRRADLDHLTRSGMLRPLRFGSSQWDRRGRASVPLYRTGDLDELLERGDIDWDQVRATPAGRPSPLIRPATAERAMAVLAGLPDPAGQKRASRRNR